jgi:hypothetical protein
MISDHETHAFRHPRILEFHKFYSEYSLWFEVGLERFKVTIRIYETNDGRFYFVQSHFLHTPLNGGPAQPAAAKHQTPHVALSTALGSITTYYDEAVDAGHEPSLDWFIKNEIF